MLTILYEDNHVLVLDKPHGIPTQGEGSLEAVAREFIKQRDNKQGNAFVFAVHRIDKPVAGVVLFAKSKKALSRLTQQVREGTIQKEYAAWVEGDVQPPQGVWEDRIGKKPHAAVITNTGKPAILSYSVVGTHQHGSQLHIHLMTGRYHQIRIQCASRKHPIIGDAKYGSHFPHKKGIKLVHIAATFVHPTTGKSLTCKSRFSP